MRIEPPASLRREHEELHRFLEAADGVQGPLAEAMRRVAALLGPHVAKEESFALPPLGLLARLARGELHPGMAQVLAHTDWLRNHFADLVAEHRAIEGAAQELIAIARAEARPEAMEFAERLVNHARMEEEVLYPAAILVGEYLRQRLAAEAPLDL